MINNKDLDDIFTFTERNFSVFSEFLNDRHLSYISQEGFELVPKEDVKISTKKFLESMKFGIAIENENCVIIGSIV